MCVTPSFSHMRPPRTLPSGVPGQSPVPEEACFMPSPGSKPWAPLPSAEPTALPCLLRKWRLQTYIHSPLKPYNPQTCARHPSPAFLPPSGYNARHDPLLSKNNPSLDLASLSLQPHPSRRSSTHCCEFSPHTLSPSHTLQLPP